MRIELQSIHFKNWKCFQEQTINFDLDTVRDRNIWVVFGNNGFGKTSLLEAILWCLYGVRAIYPDKRQQRKFATFFNSVAVEKDPNLEMSVTLTFRQSQKIYRITRVVKRKFRGNSITFPQVNLSFSVNGREKNDAPENIEALLPESCKEFFFFDGKKIEEYAKLSHSEETRNAIERVLGIPEIRNLLADSQNVKKEIEKEFRKLSDLQEEFEKINQQLDDLKDKIDIKEATHNQILQELHQANKILKALDTEARQSDEAQGKFDEINNLEKQEITLRKDLEQVSKDIKDSFSKAPIFLLSNLIREITDEIHTETLIGNKQLADASLLEKLIISDSCICGQNISDEVRQFLIKQLEEAKTSRLLYEQAIENQKLHTELSKLCNSPPLELELLLLRRDRIEEDLSEIEQRIEKLKQDTEGFDRESIKNIWNKLYKQELEVKRKQDRIEQLEVDIDKLKAEEDKLQQTRRKLASQNKEAANLSKQSDLADRLYDATDELVRWQIDNSREIIEKHTSATHQGITNKPEEYKGVCINNDYTLGIKLKSGKVVSPEAINFSAGEKEALAFAFITGLNQASGEGTLLVMDTPFGHLDPEHKDNIINSLPDLPLQVIVLATGADLPDKVLQDLSPHIAQTHIISRKGENEFTSVIKVKE